MSNSTIQRFNDLTAAQLEFPSLRFDPSRTVLYVHEVADKLRMTEQHVIDLIDEGKLRAINIAGANATDRKFYRIPAEAYYDYLKANTL